MHEFNFEPEPNGLILCSKCSFRGSLKHLANESSKYSAPFLVYIMPL